MSEIKLGAVESRFADIIWQNEPLPSNELARLAEREIGWKKSTTYTILRRLCDRGIFKNEGGVVSSQMTREEFFARQSEKFVDDAFGGSLPAFVAAFGSRKKLSDGEIEELKRLIEAMRG